MKLSILVPQFMENEEIIHNLLDSINLQQYVNFEDIEVIIMNDGTNVKLSRMFLSRYNYKIKYLNIKHSGASATRNALLSEAQGDYIMFCDADDMFLDSLALSYLLDEIKKGFDLFIGSFYESLVFDEENKISFVPHINDVNFIHNKIFKKDLLIKNNIKFDESININEDGQFVGLAMICAENVKIGNIINYLWKYRKNSAVRQDPDLAIKTHQILIKNTDIMNTKALDLNKHKLINKFMNDLFYQSYCILYKTKEDWFNEAFCDIRLVILNSLKSLYNKYKDYITEIFKEEENVNKNPNKFKDTISYEEFIKQIKEA